MLRIVAADCGAFGAALWQARIMDRGGGAEVILEESRPATQGDLEAPDRVGLFVLAHGFEDRGLMCAYHKLPLTSATGRALDLPKAEHECKDCSASDSGISHESDFYKKAKPGSLFAVRIVFQDKSLGALTLYRERTGAFPDEMKQRARLRAGYVPAFCSAILDRVSYGLVEKVSGLVERSESDYLDVLNEIARETAAALACRETSIFLEDRLVQVGRFNRVSTTSEELATRTDFIASDSGFTPMVVREKKPVLALDLTDPDSRLSARASFTEAAAAEVKKRARKLLNPDKPDSGECPPISLVAIPIVARGKCIGALRCQLRPESPYYFSEGDAQLLRIVAARIGFFWNRCLRLRENENAVGEWKSFVDGLNALKAFGNDTSVKSNIFERALTVLENCVRGAEICEVSLVSADRQTCETLVLRDKGQTSARKISLPLKDPPTNSWAYVFHHYRTQPRFAVVDSKNPGMPYEPVFPDVKQALFTPIVADGDCIGVLSVRTRSSFPDWRKAEPMASLVALQISLYYRLANLLSQQSRTFQDLAHQLRTPVFQASKRLQRLVGRSSEPEYELQAVNGLMAKTRRVLGNIRLYEELAVGRVLPSRTDRPIEDLIRLLREACSDNRVLWRTRGMTFTLDSDSLAKIKIRDVYYDTTLIEQVINNLLDNAGKYGQPSTEVVVSASTIGNRVLEIVVRSRAGVRIEDEDAARAGERGFRSEMAKRRTTEGQGIGLYLVKQIMQAHRGDLKVAETDSAGFNRISITIPLGK